MLAFLRDAGWPAYAAAGVVLAVTLAIAQARRRRAARARVREALGAAPAPREAWRDGAEVTLRGVLRAERPVTALALIGFAGREQVELATGAVDDGSLEVGDTRVALDGAVAIAVGSHVVRHHELPRDHFEAASVARARVRRATELHLWRGGIDGYHVRRLSPGDEVLARGRLVLDVSGRGPGDVEREARDARAEESDHPQESPAKRASAAANNDQWRLTPIRDAIELAAVGGVVDPVQMPPQTAMGQAVVFGGIAFLATAYLMALQ